jgi:hypothetical protein
MSGSTEACLGSRGSVIGMETIDAKLDDDHECRGMFRVQGPGFRDRVGNDRCQA